MMPDDNYHPDDNWDPGPPTRSGSRDDKWEQTQPPRSGQPNIQENWDPDPPPRAGNRPSNIPVPDVPVRSYSNRQSGASPVPSPSNSGQGSSGSRRRRKNNIKRKNRQQKRPTYPSPSSPFQKPLPRGNRRATPTPDSFLVCLAVKSELMGGIIGRGGATIASYRERTECIIKSTAKDNQPERLITFKGHRNNVLNAIELVVDNIADQKRSEQGHQENTEPDSDHPQHSSSSDMPPDLKPSAIDAPGSPGVPEPAGERGGDSKVELGAEESNPIIDVVIMIPADNVGHVIGKEGQMVNRIRKESSAHIDIEKAPIATKTALAGTISGTRDSVWTGLRMIVGILSDRHDRMCEEVEAKNRDFLEPLPPRKRSRPSPQERKRYQDRPPRGPAPPERPERRMQLPFQTPFYLRTPRPNAPQFQNSYYMSTPKVREESSGNHEEKKMMDQLGISISQRGSNESEIKNVPDLANGADDNPNEVTVSLEDEEFMNDPEFRDLANGGITPQSPPELVKGRDEAEIVEEAKKMVTALRATELEDKAKAVKEISEITDRAVIKSMISQGLISKLSQLLNPHITQPRSDIILNTLRTIGNVLEDGKEETPNPHAQVLSHSGALQLIEHLQNHTNMNIYHRAIQILEYFPDRGRQEMLSAEQRRRPVR